MAPKFYCVILCVVGFCTVSCNTKRQEKSNDSSALSNSKMTETNSPSDDFLVFENKLHQDSLNVGLRTTLALNYYSAGELSKASYHFLIIYALDNKNIIALKNLGNIYYDSREDDKAIQYYKKALAIDPGNLDMKCDLATCYSRINELKKAIVILRENIQTDNSHKQSHYNLSVLLNQSGKTIEANEEMKIYDSLTSVAK